MEPKVKPLVAFAAVTPDDTLLLWSLRARAGMCREAVALWHTKGWGGAERDGYRVIPVRIGPVEE